MHGRAWEQYIFRSYNTYTFNAVCFDQTYFTCRCEKENKKAETDNWSLVSEIALTTGLCSEGWYSEHSGVCMQKSGAAVKECKGEDGLMSDNLKAKWLSG